MSHYQNTSIEVEVIELWSVDWGTMPHHFVISGAEHMHPGAISGRVRSIIIPNLRGKGDTGEEDSVIGLQA